MRDNLTLGTQGGLEAQSELTVRLASKVQCQGGQDKTIQPHLHCSKPHLCVGKISWPLQLHNTHPHTNAYTRTCMHIWMRAHTRYADMLCDCSPSTNLGHWERTETKGILLAPPPKKNWQPCQQCLCTFPAFVATTVNHLVNFVQGLNNASHSCMYQFHFCIKFSSSNLPHPSSAVITL